MAVSKLSSEKQLYQATAQYLRLTKDGHKITLIVAPVLLKTSRLNYRLPWAHYLSKVHLMKKKDRTKIVF